MKCFILQLNNNRIIYIYVKECIYKILQSLGNKDFFSAFTFNDRVC